MSGRVSCVQHQLRMITIPKRLVGSCVSPAPGPAHDVPVRRRLRDAETLGGTGEIAFLRNGQEVAQLPYV